MDSLCWECGNAYANRCAWIGSMTPVWEQAIKESRVAATKGRKVYVVTECKHYRKKRR